MAFFVIFTLPKSIDMKTKILSVALLAIFFYSCSGSKSVTPATTVVAEKEIKKDAVSPEIAEGKNLYENNCAKCHKLYEAADFSKEEWKPIVLRMQKKAHIDDLAGEKIYNYLTVNL